MKKAGKIALFSALFCTLLICFYANFPAFAGAQDNATMVIEANILVTSEPEIGVAAPDYIFFGNVSVGECSPSVKFYVNNTGKTDIIVYSKLSPSYIGKIFNYTFFKLTGDPYYNVNDFNMSITTSTKSRPVYAILNLTDYPDTISEDMIGHQTEVTFWAVAA